MNISSTILCRIFLVASILFSYSVNAETDGSATYRDYPEWDWDLFDGQGWTPRYAYLDGDNMIGYAHYAGMAYYHRRGGEFTGAVFRYGHGTMGKKYNVSYSNAFSLMSVDFGFSYHVLDDNNPRELEDLELLGLEIGLRLWVVQIIATHTEDYSWATLAYGF